MMMIMMRSIGTKEIRAAISKSDMLIGERIISKMQLSPPSLPKEESRGNKINPKKQKLSSRIELRKLRISRSFFRVGTFSRLRIDSCRC